MRSKLIAKKISSDGSDAIRIEDGSDRSIAADLDPRGAARLQIRGSSPQNEEGALEICRTLVLKLNERGGTWSAPTRTTGVERGVDCQAKGPNGELLDFQVTRPAPEELWRDLGHVGAARQALTVSQAADLLVATIRKKAGRTTAADRASVVLALDVRNTPAFGFKAVAQDCRTRFLAEVASYGFLSVWVVGELPSLTFRLDR